MNEAMHLHESAAPTAPPTVESRAQGPAVESPNLAPISAAIKPRPQPVLYRGNENELSPEDLKDPAVAARAIVSAWNDGVDAVRRVSKLVASALREFRKDAKRLDAFIDELVKLGWLTENEAKQGAASPKLNKLGRLGEESDLFNDPEIRPNLPLGYSPMYQLLRVHDELPGDAKEKKERLVRILKERDQDVTRDFLIEQTRLLKAEKKVRAKPESASKETAGAVTSSLPELMIGKQKYDLITIDARTIGTLLREEMSPGYAFEDGLPLRDVVQEKACAVVLTRVSDLPGVAEHLLVAAGFSSITSVLLLEEPTGPAITKSAIVVIAQRGGIKPNIPTVWSQAKSDAELTEIADRLFPDAVSKLNVFAKEAVPGWVSLVGDASWSKKPSLK